MATETDEELSTLGPDEAFAVLGNETRMDILQTLAESNESLPFSELRDRVGVSDSGQFNYHLDQLTGHFLRKTDDGYELRKAGRSVVEAVLSGAITDDLVLEPTEIDFACRHCGTPIKVSFSQERLEMFCSECAGHYETETGTRESIFPGDHGFLGGYTLPPAGIRGRTAQEALRAASTWTHLEFLARAHDLCPRCSAIVDHDITVCENHDASDGICEHCDRRYAVQMSSHCKNCPHKMSGMFGNYVLANLDLRSFVADHGIDPIIEGVKWGWDYREEVLSVNPFRARFTYTIEDEAISLTVDDDLDVVDVKTAQVPDDE